MSLVDQGLEQIDKLEERRRMGMDMEKTKRALRRINVSASQVAEILDVYADETEELEPYAINDIEAARNMAANFRDME